ncbi:interferon regulatory factor 9 [Nerophis ophidion]|uniref:interferon regulatory factor 9 n=1 Tax=Nerophis ophidion TaxID=159077 RepID=UPI002ADFFDAB|nr:interferon regulatory factor 9 [Nerophis ophidion]XP_061777301.1 interferon regulatory factor 9 [Nerophis ophidion]
MARGKTRCTRKLCAWMVQQVDSGKYPGLVWDNEAKTMFRIPWKHAGKQDFRMNDDAAIFKAWAEFKGKSSDNKPAVWKTRLRCALNKSPEFNEVHERAQLDISEPYKVYRLVPPSQQNLRKPKRKSQEKGSKRLKRRRMSSESDSEDVSGVQEWTTEDVKAEAGGVGVMESDRVPQADHAAQQDAAPREGGLSEIQLDVRIEESAPPFQEDQDSLHVTVCYLGQEVLTRQIHGDNVRILYAPPSPVPPTPAPDSRFPRIHLPEPPCSLLASEQQQQQLRALLPFMEKGVALSSTTQGIYGRRFCRGRVFWRGPHTRTPGPHKMERSMDPVLLFSKDAFKQQSDEFYLCGGEAPGCKAPDSKAPDCEAPDCEAPGCKAPGCKAPDCSFILCFGEELSSSEDPSTKLITVKVTLVQAQGQTARDFLESLPFLQGEITLDLVPVPTTPESSL